MPEMKELQFETGLVTFSLNGRSSVTFNPTDSNFMARFYDAFDLLDQKQEEYRETVSKMADKRMIFDFMRERDREMRRIIDEALGAPVCDELFGGMNVYSMASGLPVWANLMLAFMDEMDTAFTREQKATNPRVQKYLKKYHR